MPSPNNNSPSRVNQAERSELRRKLRAYRRSLSQLQQTRAARALTRQLMLNPLIQRSRHIAVYLPNDGEIDPRPFMAYGRRHGKTFYLPVLHPVYKNRLWFVRVDATTALQPNRYGIPEPDPGKAQRRSPWSLDLILLPLVGFDSDGGRLGMGGGYYDRTFAYKRAQASPCLIGLAHDGQRVAALPIAPWDVPLNAVVTDRNSYQAGQQARVPSKGNPGTAATAKHRLFFGRYRLQNQSRRWGRLKANH